MESLRVTLVQSDLYWENPTANLAMFEEKISGLVDQTDLIVLPEMFNTGFSTNYSEPMNLTTHKWMKQMATQTGAIVTGSMGVKEKSGNYNRLLWVHPSGATDYYDKKHLFKYGGEHEKFSPGQSKLIKPAKDFNISTLICYDLRFPVWSRNISNGFDVLIYVASWPEPRIEAWSTLLKARAIENQCYVIGVNRLGSDGNGLKYNGQSAIIDYKGQVIEQLGDREIVKTFEISKEPLLDYRNQFPFYKDADAFEILH
ncbi:amidohydrolase [Emticicia sp. CRIBPO]|uniref:amidohydrolase n=1 Tax=Emticicia sp. CRIBPO TaxID=2683258 RepID=UPI0014122408|nr:amidohydrolase [Emticicia sp. CRIBPO]NBA88852.1 amidohydrolase [Emticicia sp. CRIBPO]